MTNMPPHWGISEFRDPGAINYITSEQHKAEAKEGDHESGLVAHEQARRGVLGFGRDNGRTPMQWASSSRHAGFSEMEGDTWMKVNHNYGPPDNINVEDQQQDNHSIWQFWKKRISMRKEYRDILMHGQMSILDEENDEIFMYTKIGTDRRMAVVVLNFSGTECPFPWNRSAGQQVWYLAGNVCDSDTCGNVDGGPGRAWDDELGAWEGRVLLVESP